MPVIAFLNLTDLIGLLIQSSQNQRPWGGPFCLNIVRLLENVSFLLERCKYQRGVCSQIMNTLTNFYRCTIGSILTSCMATPMHINTRGCREWWAQFGPSCANLLHHALFPLLPSDRRCRSPKLHTSRFGNSYIPTNIRLLNQPAQP